MLSYNTLCHITWNKNHKWINRIRLERLCWNVYCNTQWRLVPWLTQKGKGTVLNIKQLFIYEWKQQNEQFCAFGNLCLCDFMMLGVVLRVLSTKLYL